MLRIPTKYSISAILYTIILLELFMGGGGRMIEIGSLTLRMYLFVFSLMITLAIYISRNRMPLDIILICAAGNFMIFFSAVLGFINGADPSLVYEDIKPLLFINFILIAYFFIDSMYRIQLTSKVLKLSAFVLAFSYLIVLSLLLTGKIAFLPFYNWVSDFGEFFFRGNQGFFTYKGFIYMSIGFIIYLYYPARKKELLKTFIILLAIILTGTRGYLAGLFIVFIGYYFLPKILKGRVLYILLLIPPLLFSIWFISNMDLGDKAYSDSFRVIQIQQVASSLNLISFFIGQGFGIGTEIRPVHMEIAYAEIFHKQGIVGLGLWGLLMFYIYSLYQSLDKYKAYAKPYYLSVIFVFLMSFTNPYINNPIGMSIILITLVIIKKLNEFEKKQDINLPGYL